MPTRIHTLLEHDKKFKNSRGLRCSLWETLLQQWWNTPYFSMDHDGWNCRIKFPLAQAKTFLESWLMQNERKSLEVLIKDYREETILYPTCHATRNFTKALDIYPGAPSHRRASPVPPIRGQTFIRRQRWLTWAGTQERLSVQRRRKPLALQQDFREGVQFFHYWL